MEINDKINNKYGYARLGSKSQESNSSIESQKQQLIQNGIEEETIRLEVGSAVDSISERPIFQKLIDQEFQKNDLLLVTKIDRCSRNTLEFLKLQEKLFQKKVTFLSLGLPYSNDIAVNKLIATNLAAIATFETERRRERQKEGILAAQKAGKYLGRKTVITPKLIAEVQDLKETKKFSKTQIARLTGKGGSTIQKILKQELNYLLYHRLIKLEQPIQPEQPEKAIQPEEANESN